jgi:hypothetical protein
LERVRARRIERDPSRLDVRPRPPVDHAGPRRRRMRRHRSGNPE